MTREEKRRLKQAGKEVPPDPPFDLAAARYYRRPDQWHTPSAAERYAAISTSITWHNRYRTLLHQHPEKGHTKLPSKIPYERLEAARQHSQEDGGRFVVLAPEGIQSTDEIYSCSLGCWNITMMQHFCQQAAPLFGPQQVPLSADFISHVIQSGDPDPRYIKHLGGKYDPQDLIRPVLFLMNDYGQITQLDGLHRLINLWYEGFRACNAYIVPAAICDCFRMFYFWQGKEEDYAADNEETQGRYVDRNHKVHIEGATPEELAAAQTNHEKASALMKGLMEKANREGRAEHNLGEQNDSPSNPDKE